MMLYQHHFFFVTKAVKLWFLVPAGILVQWYHFLVQPVEKKKKLQNNFFFFLEFVLNFLYRFDFEMKKYPQLLIPIYIGYKAILGLTV